MANPQTQVHRIWKDYKPNPKDPGEMKETAWVEYGPVGDKARTTTIAKVDDIINRLQPLEGSSDPAVVIAHMRADIVRKAYEAFCKGEESPVEGTPLAAWNALSPEQSAALKLSGIRSVEEIAGLTESTASRMPFPNKQEIIKQAKAFVESKDQVRLAAALTKKDEEIALLRSENEERDQREAALMRKIDALAEMVASREAAADDDGAAVRRGPGRPPKQPQTAAAA